MRSALLLFLTTLVIMLGVLEGATRWIFADVTSTADGTSFFGKRWLRQYEGPLNAHGFREREIEAKPPGVLRVVVVGDSFTYGQGIAREARLTERLDAALGPDVEVYNFGIYGANYPEHSTSMATAIEVAEPDFVILQWYTNDMQPPDDQSPGASHLAGPLHPHINPHSALYFLANTAFRRVQRAVGSAPTFDDQFAPFHDPKSAEARDARARLEQVLDVAREAARPHGMILWPSVGLRVRLDDFMGEEALFTQVLDVCRDRSLPCLDLRPALRDVPIDESLTVNQFDSHPNALANRYAAEATAGWLRQLLPSVPGPAPGSDAQAADPLPDRAMAAR